VIEATASPAGVPWRSFDLVLTLIGQHCGEIITSRCRKPFSCHQPISRFGTRQHYPCAQKLVSRALVLMTRNIEDGPCAYPGHRAFTLVFTEKGPAKTVRRSLNCNARSGSTDIGRPESLSESLVESTNLSIVENCRAVRLRKRQVH